MPLFNDRLDSLPPSPFYQQLPALFAPLQPAPGLAPIDMSLGDPRHPLPEFVAPILAKRAGNLGRYSPTAGPPEFKVAVARYLVRRYGLPEASLDPESMVTHVAGTREGLFMIPLVAVPERARGGIPAVLMPNPFYPTYAGAALAAGAEPVFVAATKENGYLPDYRSVPREVLERTAVIFFCSPSNPQGVVANVAYLQDLIALARSLDALLVVDECYADVYDDRPPAGTLEACMSLDGRFNGVVVFHSLSKRSNLPGLRSGFAMGDPAVMDRFRRLRQYGAVAPPRPTAEVAIACWSDDAHVAANRGLYRRKIDLAESLLGKRFGFYRPPGGFFLWLDVGDGEAAAAKLWSEAAVKVVPGAYLTRANAAGHNHGRPYIRVALVPDEATTLTALQRIAETLA